RLVRGEALTDIAASLCVSAKTISTYKMRLMDKLQLSSEAALVRYAIRHQLFADDDVL
ncbi:LuxR C-terminal-related transcriptional regulator, partial [Ralstonia solanacearum]